MTSKLWLEMCQTTTKTKKYRNSRKTQINQANNKTEKLWFSIIQAVCNCTLDRSKTTANITHICAYVHNSCKLATHSKQTSSVCGTMNILHT